MDETQETLPLSLPREQWMLLIFAASQGAQTILTQFLDGKGHKAECVIDYAHAVIALNEQYKKAVEDLERVKAELKAAEPQ